MNLTLGSLFAGVGGFDLGFERAGFKTIWQVEIDKNAQSVLRRRFPDSALHSDVREVGGHNLPPVDVLTYGFPCTDVSQAGRRAGLAGERSGLFHEAIRVIRELRERYGKPDFAIAENVPGLFTSGGGGQTSPSLFKRYSTSGRVTSHGECWTRSTSESPSGAAESLLWQILQDSVPSRYSLSQKACAGILRRADRKGKKLPQVLRIALEAMVATGTGGGIADTLDVSMLVKGQMMPEKRRFPCVLQPIPRTTGTICADSHPGAYSGQDAYTDRLIPALTTTERQWAVRRLTVTETERLQGFSDGWTEVGILPDGREKPLADGPRYKAMGNAVTVNVSEWIAKRLVATLRP